MTTKKSGRLTIARLTVHGVLGVEDSTIDLEKITVLSGQNASGKSTHLKALRSCLGIDRTALARLTRIPDGQDAAAPEDLLPGEPSVEVLLVGEDREVQVTRRGSGSPEVRERVGEDWRKVPRPVEWLHALLDVEAANPALWLAADDEARATAVLAAMPLEGYSREAALQAAGLLGFRLPPLPTGLHPLEDLELVEDAVFSARTEIKRQERAEHDAATKLLSGLPAEAPGDVADRIAQSEEAIRTLEAQIVREEAAAEAAQREAVQSATATAKAAVDKATADFREKAAKLRAFHESAAAEARAEAERLVAKHLAEVEAKIAEFKEWADIEAGTAREAEAKARQAAVLEREEARAESDLPKRALAEVRELLAADREQQRSADTDRHVRATAEAAEAKARDHEARAGELTAGIEALRRYRLELAGRLPVKGLAVAFDEKGRKSLTLDGVPLAQVNTGRLVELATEVSLLRCGKGTAALDVILLDGIENLDPKARAALLREVAARGAQVIAAAVTDGPFRVLRGEDALS